MKLNSIQPKRLLKQDTELDEGFINSNFGKPENLEKIDTYCRVIAGILAHQAAIDFLETSLRAGGAL